MNKKVSIIIINYNGKRFLEKLLFSLAAQTYRNFEVIFVDNASIDGSIGFLRQFIDRVPLPREDVKIICNKRNLGFCIGNNVGLKYATGEYIAFLNNDTYVNSDWLEELVKVLENNEHVAGCQSKIIDAVTG